MSLKSILLTILALVLAVGFLFLVVFLFNIYFVLGIIGIIVWMVVPGLVLTKAVDAATGFVDKLLAKYIAPIVGAILQFGTIIYIIGMAIESC